MFSKKLGFFHNSLQPIPRLHIAAREFRSYQSNAASVNSIGWPFSVLSIPEPSAGEGGEQNTFLKNTFFSEHPVSK